MVAKPILRVGKIKSMGASTPISVHSHLARNRTTPNASSTRTPSNVWIVGSADQDLDSDITATMALGGIDRSKLRKDAVLANDIMLTISPEFFRPEDPERHGHYEPDRVEVFKAEAEQLLRKTFGKRLVSAVMHLDEATPHIQAVVVPVMKGKENGPKWRLSSKDMFGPSELSRLQQDWEDRLQPHGVGPRTKGSRARHTTLREYYGALEAARTEDPRPGLEISEPPVKGRLEGSEAYQSRVEAWRKDEAKRLRQELQPLAQQASRGRLYDAEKRARTALRGELAESATELGKVRLALAETQERLDLSKEQVGRLRGLPINQVAAALEYTGEIAKRENAIDLVKRVGEVDYADAVQWLAQQFGPDAAGAAIREKAAADISRSVEAPPVFTKAEKTKAKLVDQQLSALGADQFRITLMRDVKGRQVGQNIGKDRDTGKERLFSRAEVVQMIPKLAKANRGGANVFITPMDQSTIFILADDLKKDRLAELERRGYAEAVTMETSPGNFQRVLKVPSHLVDRDDANEFFKDLNREIGDPKITGLVHPFRLSGFENRKDKHRDPETGRYPFVRLISAVNRYCERAVAVIREYQTRREQTFSRGPRM